MKEIIFSPELFKNPPCFKLARIYQMLNAFYYTDKNENFDKDWEILGNNLYHFIMEVDLNFNKNQNYNYNKYFNDISCLFQKYKKINSDLFNKAYDIFKN